MHEGCLQRARNRKYQYQMINEASCRLGEYGKNLIERCAHVIRDYIPLAEIWLENTVYPRYKTVMFGEGYSWFLQRLCTIEPVFAIWGQTNREARKAHEAESFFLAHLAGFAVQILVFRQARWFFGTDILLAVALIDDITTGSISAMAIYN